MLFTTPTQWIAVAVALVAGWLLGLASHPGGRKWKQRYADERAAHAETRRTHDTRAADDRARVAELERDNARLARAAPVSAAMRPRTTAAPAYPAGERRGWFDWGARRNV